MKPETIKRRIVKLLSLYRRGLSLAEMSEHIRISFRPLTQLDYACFDLMTQGRIKSMVVGDCQTIYYLAEGK